MPHTGHNHGQLVFIRGFDDLFVPDTAAGLDHGGHAGLGRRINSIPKREEGIGRHDRTPDGKTGFPLSQLNGIHAAHLSGTDADGLRGPGQHNGNWT